MDARFPLLKLPEKASRRVLQVMDTHEIFGFSLISKECKKMSISSKTKAYDISVNIRGKITISFCTIHGHIYLIFYKEPNLEWITGSNSEKKTLKPPKAVEIEVHRRRDTLKWENTKDFGLKEWLEHIHTVFDCHKDRIHFNRNSFRFDIDYVKETFGNTEDLSVHHSGSYEYNESILKKFLPIEKVSFEANVFPDSKIPPRILIQNFDTLSIDQRKDGLKCISLDDLLVINSKRIYIDANQTPVKMLNKFVKLWKKGANPRMEHFEIMCDNGSETDIDVILDGIKCNEIRQESRPDMLANKVFDTYRMDGTKATIKFKCWNNTGGLTQFRLII
ncbi:hypothetical protein CAEBREN_00487 [Caenorhabditis brenneri]|uniref:F-box domain-containing protein n=1 Tax=Caenorhabditis brenneri TaxID=135651 RepID=G0NS94_CAEBE|nr:hypothetical protein CAEBREN_00487 [Caenorhabditis brenneri]